MIYRFDIVRKGENVIDTLFRWNRKLELGIPLIDDQHRKLLECSNSLTIALSGGNAENKAREVIRFMEQYILYHFQAEEAFQVECNYPQYREHQAIHSRIGTLLKYSLVELSESKFTPEDIDKFYTFFRETVEEHIWVEDAEFAGYYRNFKRQQEAQKQNDDM